MNVYRDIPFTIYTPTVRKHFYDEIVKLLPNLEVTYFDGTNKGSYSKILNTMLVECPTELFFLISDKIRPTEQQVYDVIDLIIEGHGMVWLWPFSFGAFYKEVIRRIGFWDERFVDGNYEDCDMWRRLRESNISLVEIWRTTRLTLPSTWPAAQSANFMNQKWGGDWNFTRLLPDETYDYDLGESHDSAFKTWNESIMEKPDTFIGSQEEYEQKIRI